MTSLDQVLEAIDSETASVEQIRTWLECSARASCGPIGEKALKQLIRLSVLAEGYPLGLCDSAGREFKVGCVVRRSAEINEDMHGSWVEYEVTLQGTTPILSYLRSETGDVLPRGYTAGCLSDIYDMKMFVFAKDSMTLRPDDEVFIQPDSSN